VKRSVLARWASRLCIIGLIVVLAAGLVPGMAPATARAQSTCSAWHIVGVGENLYRIGLRYGVPYPVIAAANGISNPNRINAGQRICIPAYSGGFVTGTTSTVAQPATLVVPPYVDLLPDLPFYYPLVEPVTGNLGHQSRYWPQYGGRWNLASIILEPAIQIWTPCEPEAVLYDLHLACSKTGLGWFISFSLLPPEPAP